MEVVYSSEENILEVGSEETVLDVDSEQHVGLSNEFQDEADKGYWDTQILPGWYGLTMGEFCANGGRG